MKLSKDKRDRVVLTCLAAVGVAGALYTFVLGAQKDTLATLDRQLLAARDKLGKAERLIQHRPILEADYQSTKTVLTAREEHMSPEGQYYYWFLKLIEQFREDERLAPEFIMDITPQPEFIEAGLVPNFPFKAASFGLRLNGRFHDVGRFIANLENEFPYFRIQNIKMVPQKAPFPGVASPKQPVIGSGTTDSIIVELRVVTLIRGGTT
jgi:hypothetical protein